MTIRQISVFLENTSGRIAEAAGLLGDSGINLRAATIADTADFGILRLIVDDPERAMELFKEAGFTAKGTDVFAVEVDDVPGGFAAVMKMFYNNDVNIEYFYTSLERGTEKAVIIFRIEDTGHGSEILKRHGIHTVSKF